MTPDAKTQHRQAIQDRLRSVGVTDDEVLLVAEVNGALTKAQSSHMITLEDRRVTATLRVGLLATRQHAIAQAQKGST